MKKITIIGAGSFGSAIAQIFTDKNYSVMLYTNKEEQRDEINKKQTNRKIYEDFIFDKKVKATIDIKEAINFSEYIIIALPSKFIREVLNLINKNLNSSKTFINVSKGIEPSSNKLINEIIEEEIDQEKRNGIVIVSGPSHAEEIIKKHFTLLLAASKNHDKAVEIQLLFSNEYIRVYSSTDIKGIQIAATVKNTLSLASGIVYGMGYGDNTRAALISRGLVEMVRYGKLHGAKEKTFYGLAGIGDLVVTATSYHSRNFQTGLRIGKGMTAKEAVDSSKTVVEGVRAAKAIYLDIKDKKIEMPICKGIYEVFYKEKDPEKVISELFERSLKKE